MLSQSDVDAYLNRLQRLYAMHLQGGMEKKELLRLTLEEARKHQHDQTAEQFFKAESDLINEDYQSALSHYLETPEVPLHHFFCYRASSFLYCQLGQEEKALEFAERALHIRPNDLVTLRLLVGGIDLIRDTNKWSQWKNRMETILKIHACQRGDSENGGESSFEGNLQVKIGKEIEEQETPETSEIPETPETPLEREEEVLTEMEETPMQERTIREEQSMIEEDSQVATLNEESEPMQKISDTEKEEFIPEQSYESARAATQQYISENLGVDPAASEVLNESIRVFKEFQDALVTHYIERYESRQNQQDYFLLVLNGWSERQAAQTRDLKKMPHQIDPRIFSEGFENTEGGYFIRWQGKGIAVNPGRQFLDSLHRSGLSVRDIDFVIVTRQNPEAFEDVKAIHQINYKLNSVKSDRLHLIHYYLHQNAYRHMSSDLKANFKQEKNSVHSLDFYLDSPELEKVTLFEGCVLQYFPTTISEINLKKGKEEEEKLQGALGVKFELTHENSHIRIGYLSGTGWTPYLASHLGGCDVLITGLEYVNKNDYEKVKYHEAALGYYGSFSLLEEIAPRLLLCCEFGGDEGDIRLEVVHKMRKEFTPTTSRASTILPGDHGLSVDLLRFEINCSVTGVPVDPSKIHVVKTQDAFGKLLYLSSKTFI